MTDVKAVAMTEDELLLALCEALTLAGWRWTHIRRSDGITMGMAGLPDLIAVHPERDVVLAWELKGTGGVVTSDQAAWIAGFTGRTLDARVVWPTGYDEALVVVLGDRRIR